MGFGCGVSGRALRAFVGIVGVVAVAMAAASPAEAARKRRGGGGGGGGYSPPYAAMVVDAKSGRTLHAVNEDAPRIPASITKVMTLYLLFEQLERGRFSMDSEFNVSANASRQAPSKLGLRPGSTIEVRDAIMALITKSANDVAMVVAENVGGSEDEFARMMTARARSLGMSRSAFYNPHGLPHDPPNITTARDLTVLARAIQERFPRYYGMFSSRSFRYAGRVMPNHNKLLGRVEGVDGIKTGYTRLSGFNLMTSAKSDGRHIVSIVLGGRSGAHRDRIMSDLVVATLPKASTSGRSSVMVAEAEEEVRPRPQPVAQPQVAAAVEPPPMPAPRPRIEAEPQPLPSAVRAYAPVQVTTTPIAPPRAVGQARPLQLNDMRTVSATTTPSAMRWQAGAQPADAKVLRPPANVDVTSSIAKLAEPEERKPLPARQPEVAVERKVENVTAQPKSEPRQAETRQAEVRTATAVASGKWVIQLGATDDEAKAKDILARARATKGGPLADASGFLEKVEKGGATLFRARFAGFEDPKDAQNACVRLKRDGFACFATRS